MSVTSGQRLGAYVIIAKLGEGGMGEVWRATDSRLRREVAIKVLPAAFTADAERLARFEREAQLLAQLNHPNIAHVYGLETNGDTHALVMELVDGEDLAQRIARGPLALDEALAVAKQIAEGLEAAHERGIVHRDLKPANVKVRADGTVKVLDFGLAKAMDAASDTSSSSGGAVAALARSPTLMNSPTLTAAHGTQLGVILGTAAYMAPEQARGKAVDKRADIWAFGALLFEMLTGRRAFDGSEISDVLASVLKSDPEWSALPADTPPAVRRLLRRCLAKDPRERLHDIADARLELAGASEDAVTASAPPPAAAARTTAMRVVVVIAAVALGAAAVLAVLESRALSRLRSEDRSVIHAQLALGSGERLAIAHLSFGRAFAISPDGRTLVYAVTKGAGAELRVRALDGGASTTIAGSDGGTHPFFSPDGKWVGFFAGGKLEKVALAGGAPQALADAPNLRGACWADDGSIYFVPTVYAPIARIAADGGGPQVVTRIDTAKGEIQHRWPEALPGGKVLLYAVGRGGDWDQASIVAQRLASGERKVLVQGGTFPRYRDGRLFFARANSLFVVAFDPEKLTVQGAPVEVAKNVYVDARGLAHMDLSRTGMLVTAPADGVASASILSWVDRQGHGESLRLAPQNYLYVRLAPTDDRAVLNVGNAISVLDLGRGSLTQLTLPLRAENPVWSRDGRSIYFGYEQGGHYQPFVKAADDSDAPRLMFPSEVTEDPLAVSPDGSVVLVIRSPPSAPSALVMHDLRAANVPRTLAMSPTLIPTNVDFSRDGRFVVYEAIVAGRSEIFVRPASGADRQWRISVDGGTYPVWSRSGDEIFFVAGSSLVATPVTARGDELVVGQPKVLFSGHQIVAYDVTADGQRFLLAEDPHPDAQTPLDLVVHWDAEVDRRLAEAQAP